MSSIIESVSKHLLTKWYLYILRRKALIIPFRGVSGCRAGQETGSLRVAGHQHHRHGLAVRQMQQELLITDWALRPSAYPSVRQSVIFDGALHVCVCVCVCVILDVLVERHSKASQRHRRARRVDCGLIRSRDVSVRSQRPYTTELYILYWSEQSRRKLSPPPTTPALTTLLG